MAITNVSDKKVKDESKTEFVIPDLSVKELLNAIPKDCFERSAFKSSLFVVQDAILSAILIYSATFIPHLTNVNNSPILSQISNEHVKHYSSLALSAALWSTFWFALGLVWTGIWVIAHECGHQAYSTSKFVNNFVGFFLHSFLLVPYHSWRISHARHHASTGHMTKDEVFVPKTRSRRTGEKLNPDETDEGVLTGINVPEQEQMKVAELLEDAPLATFVNVVLQQLLGWPLYLIRNASGQPHYPKLTNHFSPSSIIFDARHFGQILLSDLGIGLMLGGLYYWAQLRGFAEVVKFYLIPYLWVNNWLVCITFLQHTDPALPHYRDGLWSFTRGALCTVDRTFLGPIGAHILHGICETHVAHHVSSRIPHYNAWKATDALKSYLGPHYHYSDENIIKSLFKNYHYCKFVEDDGDIVFYKDGRGRAYRHTINKPNQGFSDSGIDLQ